MKHVFSQLLIVFTTSTFLTGCIKIKPEQPFERIRQCHTQHTELTEFYSSASMTAPDSAHTYTYFSENSFELRKYNDLEWELVFDDKIMRLSNASDTLERYEYRDPSVVLSLYYYPRKDSVYIVETTSSVETDYIGILERNTRTDLYWQY